MIRAGLVIAVVLWPTALAAALVDRFDQAPSVWGTSVYLAASRVCHQRPDRSFHTHGHQWPVCARCAGLYLGAPIGAVLALARRRRPGVRRRAVLRVLVPAAALTGALWLVEAAGIVAVSAVARALAAVPLGAAVAFALVTIASGRAAETDRID